MENKILEEKVEKNISKEIKLFGCKYAKRILPHPENLQICEKEECPYTFMSKYEDYASAYKARNAEENDKNELVCRIDSYLKKVLMYEPK